MSDPVFASSKGGVELVGAQRPVIEPPGFRGREASARARNRARRVCVNDGSTTETPEQRRATDRLIRDFFAAYLPVPGTFEVEV